MNKQNIGFIGCGNLALQAIKTLSGSYNIFYSNLSINQAAENLAAEKLETIDLAKKCNVIYDCISVLPEKFNENNQMGHIRINMKDLQDRI